MSVQKFLDLLLSHLWDDLGDVGPVPAVLDHNLPAGLRVSAQHAAGKLSLFEQLFALGLSELIGSQIHGDVCPQRGALRILRIQTLQVRAVAPHADVDALSDRQGVDRASIDFAKIVDDGFEPLCAGIGAEVEALQPGFAFDRPAGDLVQIVLQAGGEVIVDVLTEVLLQQPDDAEGRPGGHQG